VSLLKYTIRHRWSASVLFEAEIECDLAAPKFIKLGLAVRAAVFAGATLAGANLARADLTGATLAGANLARADLTDANLAGSDLADAKWLDGVPITKPPIQIHGLSYAVTILDRHAQIGCHCLAIEEWEALTVEKVKRIDGSAAVEFWQVHRELLLGLAKANGRPVPAP
jgi:hypothetical protein